MLSNVWLFRNLRSCLKHAIQPRHATGRMSSHEQNTAACQQVKRNQASHVGGNFVGERSALSGI